MKLVIPYDIAKNKLVKLVIPYDKEESGIMSLGQLSVLWEGYGMVLHHVVSLLMGKNG